MHHGAVGGVWGCTSAYETTLTKRENTRGALVTPSSSQSCTTSPICWIRPLMNWNGYLIPTIETDPTRRLGSLRDLLKPLFRFRQQPLNLAPHALVAYAAEQIVVSLDLAPEVIDLDVLHAEGTFVCAAPSLGECQIFESTDWRQAESSCC